MDYFAEKDRDWYYRNAVNAFLKLVEHTMGTPQYMPYLVAQLKAAANDPKIAAEIIEQDGDRIRYRNHVNGKNGKLKSCEAYLDDR